MPLAEHHPKDKACTCNQLLFKGKINPKCRNCHSRVVFGSLIYYIIATIVKGFVGLLTGSKILVADAVNSFADCVAFGINYQGVRRLRLSPFWQGILIGIVMFLSGVWILSDNVAILFVHLPGHPGILSLFVALVSFLATTHLYRVSVSALKQKPDNSSIYICMVQNKANFYSTIVALVGLTLAEAGLVYCDPLGAVLIACFQFRGAFVLFKEAFAEQIPNEVAIKRRVATALYVLTVLIVLLFAHDAHDTLNKRKVVLIPAQGQFAQSPVENMFGRAPYYFVADMTQNKTVVFMNNSQFFNGNTIQMLTALVRQNNVGTVLAAQMDPEMYAALRSVGVRVYYIDRPATVEQTFAAFQDGHLRMALIAHVYTGFGRNQGRWITPW
ncbi:MAG: cation transporter [Candidatus Omnitrophica bacterium]|nr:cation transporter [Candidatus Omnitrophota bacterium]